MTQDEIKQKMLENNLESYIDVLEKNHLLDESLLSSITDEEYISIGITALGDRKKMHLLFDKKADEKIISENQKEENSKVNTKQKFRLLSKLFLCLVIFGFFMPISCHQNGFEITQYCFDIGESSSQALTCGIMLIILFATAALSILASIVVYFNRKQISTFLDFPCLFISIGSGIMAFLTIKKDAELELEYGCFVIIAGWILSFIFLLISCYDNKNRNLEVVTDSNSKKTSSIRNLINFALIPFGILLFLPLINALLSFNIPIFRYFDLFNIGNYHFGISTSTIIAIISIGIIVGIKKFTIKESFIIGIIASLGYFPLISCVPDAIRIILLYKRNNIFETPSFASVVLDKLISPSNWIYFIYDAIIIIGFSTLIGFIAKKIRSKKTI